MPEMVDGPLDPMTMAHLRISATRAKIHNHDQVPCPECLQDIFGCGLYAFALLNRIADLEEQLRRTSEAVKDSFERLRVIAGGE